MPCPHCESSQTQELAAAKRFFARSLAVVGHAPEKGTTDGHDAYPVPYYLARVWELFAVNLERYLRGERLLNEVSWRDLSAQ